MTDTTKTIDDHIADLAAFRARQKEQDKSNGHHGEREEPAGQQRAKTQSASLPTVPYDVLARRERIPARCLIAEILPAEEAMLLSGKERSFKSFLTMEWCKSAATGLSLFGAYAVPEAVRVLLIDLENSRSRLCDRLDASLAHDGLGTSDLGGRLRVMDRDELPRWHCHALGLARLEATLVEHAPALVVIDNLRKCMPPGKDEKEAKDMLPVVTALAQMCETYHTSLVLVHHDRRDGTGYSGSGSITGSLGNDVHVKYNRKTRIASVYCESMRNAEPFAPFAVTMGLDGALVPTELPDDEEDDEEDYGTQVLDALKPGAKTVRELRDLTGLGRAALAPTIQRLKATKEVIEVGERAGGRGKRAMQYGLPAPQPRS